MLSLRGPEEGESYHNPERITIILGRTARQEHGEVILGRTTRQEHGEHCELKSCQAGRHLGEVIRGSSCHHPPFDLPLTPRSNRKPWGKGAYGS